jgi:cytochrome P450
MTDFVPPYPERMRGMPTPLQRLWRARQGLLEAWEEAAFEYEFVSTKLLSRRIFLCNSPQSVQFAFGTHNASFEQKSPEMRRVLEPLLGDGLFISGGETWRTRRRIVAPVIHVSRLKQFAPMMVEAAFEARNRWAALPQPRAIDALSEMAELTAEIICRTLFGRELGREHARDIVEAFTDYQRAAFRLDLPVLLGLPRWFPRWPVPALGRSVRRMFRVIEQIIDAHRRGEAASEDSAIGLLLNARDEDTGEPLDPVALRNEAVVLFMAGHETTANTLAWTWFILAHTPEVEARLHAELDTVIGARPPTLADVPRLVYTRAILDEVLRLYPPVPFLSREAGQDEEFEGQRIPKGSVIVVSPWLLHRHKKLWDKPDHFIPERFLAGGSGPRSKFAYVPFSIGPRICAGLAFGQTEAILCIAALAQTFRLRMQRGHVVRPICRMTLRPGDELPMTVEPRAAAIGSTTAAPAASADSCPFGHVS